MSVLSERRRLICTRAAFPLFENIIAHNLTVTTIFTSLISKQEELELSITVLICSGKSIIRVVFASLTFTKNYSRKKNFPSLSTKLFSPLFLLLLPPSAFLSFFQPIFLLGLLISLPLFLPPSLSYLVRLSLLPSPPPTSLPPLPLVLPVSALLEDSQQWHLFTVTLGCSAQGMPPPSLPAQACLSIFLSLTFISDDVDRPEVVYPLSFFLSHCASQDNGSCRYLSTTNPQIMHALYLLLAEMELSEIEWNSKRKTGWLGKYKGHRWRST